MLDPTIFRAYDIRGNSNNNLSAEIAYNIGYYFVTLNKELNNTFIVGYDGRLSTPALFDALIQGMSEAGGEIISIGLVPTPMLYFADTILKPAASLMITGSHNPKDDNGFKMVSKGAPFFGEQITKLKEVILKNYKKYEPVRNEINVNIRDLYPSYIERITQGFNISPKLKVVWDSGNGASGTVLERLKTCLPNNNILINNEIDGNFPHHHPDPTVPKNLEQLIAKMKLESADLGIAFDGDGDRIGVVTQEGRILFGDQLLCIYGKELLERKPGSTIIADVKASQVLFDYITELGGKAIMWKTGHSLIKTKMREVNAAIAGEMSGHIFFKDDYYGFDDAIYAALRLLHIISNFTQTIDQMIRQLPECYNTPEIRLEVSEEEKFRIIEILKAELMNKSITFNDIDGVRVANEYGWWLARASNTQAAIIVRCEADSENNLSIVQNQLNDLLARFRLKI